MNRRTFNRLAASLVASPFVLTARGAESPSLLVEARRKPDTEWNTYPTRTVAQLKGFQPRERRFNRYGGIPSTKTKKTGFWHPEKIDNRFWMVDPEGGLNIHRAVCSVNVGRGERNAKAFREKFGTKEAWAKAASALLRDNGFNGTGSWSDTDLLATGANLAFCPNLNLMASYGRKRGGTYQKPGHLGFPNDCIFTFDPEFATFCDQDVAEKVAAFRNNTDILGYFSDNELPFGNKTLENYLSIENPNDPGRLAAEQWIKGRGRTRETVIDQDRWEFLGFVLDKYMSITAGAIRKHDPNHLVLGPRLYGGDREKKWLLQSVARHADLISCNYYGIWTPDERHIKGWTELTGKPFMLTEWYTKGEDSGLGNTSGAGWNVRTQRDRGLFYQNFTLALLECGNCLGWHWFKYQDNDPTARGVDPSNIDSNKGMVDNDFTPYADLVSAMREVNVSAFDLIEYFDGKKAT
jgi:hypothetical protein